MAGMTQTVRHTGYGIILDLARDDLGHPDRPGLWDEVHRPRRFERGLLLCTYVDQHGAACPEAIYLQVREHGKRVAVHLNPKVGPHARPSKDPARQALTERVASVAQKAGFAALCADSQAGEARTTDILVTGTSGARIGWQIQLSRTTAAKVLRRSNAAFAHGIVPLWTVDSPKAAPINRAPWARLDEVADWKVLRSSMLAVRGGVSRLRIRECHGSYFAHCPLRLAGYGWCGGRHARMEPKEVQLDDLIEWTAAERYVPLFVPPNASRGGSHMWVTAQDKADFLHGRAEPTPTGSSPGPRPPADEPTAQDPRPADPTFHYGDPTTARSLRPPRDTGLPVEVFDWVATTTAAPPLRRPLPKACPCGRTDGLRQYISGYLCPAHAPTIPAPTRPTTSAPLSWRIEGDFPWPAHETGRCAICYEPCHRYGVGGSPLCSRCIAQHTT
jgi:hypothetical protein